MADKWDADLPAGASKISIGDDAIRENNRTLEASLASEHTPFDGVSEADGRHKFVTLQDMTGSIPTPGADEMALYSKADGGQPEMFVREESSGDEVQITKAGYLSEVLSTVAGAPAANRTMLASLIMGAVGASVNILLHNNGIIQSRDMGDSDYLNLLKLDGGDQIRVGECQPGTVQKVILMVAEDASDKETAFKVQYSLAGGDHTIWHEGNDGHGSTLDADTVDEIEGAEILNSKTGNFAEVSSPAVSASYEWSYNHGWAAYPRLVQAWLECISGGGDGGYPLGYRIKIGVGEAGSSGAGINCWVDPNWVGYSRGPNIQTVYKTGGGLYSLDKTKWKAVFHIWK